METTELAQVDQVASTEQVDSAEQFDRAEQDQSAENGRGHDVACRNQRGMVSAEWAVGIIAAIGSPGC